MVAEIRPLKILVTFKDQEFLTTKWMDFHIWQEVYVLINNIKKEYEETFKILKSSQIQTRIGKSVIIGYRFSEYEGCSRKYLSLYKDEFRNTETIKRRGKNCAQLQPTQHSLIISVSPHKMSSYKYRDGLDVLLKDYKYTESKMKISLKEEMCYLSCLQKFTHSQTHDEDKSNRNSSPRHYKDQKIMSDSKIFKELSPQDIFSEASSISGLRGSEGKHVERRRLADSFIEDVLPSNDSSGRIKTESSFKNSGPTIGQAESPIGHSYEFKEIRLGAYNLRNKAKLSRSPVFATKRTSSLTSLNPRKLKIGNSGCSTSKDERDFKCKTQKPYKISKRNGQSVEREKGQVCPEVGDSILEVDATTKNDTLRDFLFFEPQHRIGELMLGSMSSLSDSTDHSFDGFPDDGRKCANKRTTYLSEFEIQQKRRKLSKWLRSFSDESDTQYLGKSEGKRKRTFKGPSSRFAHHKVCGKSVEKQSLKKQEKEESDSLFSDIDSLPDLMMSLSDNLSSDAEFTNPSKPLRVPHSQKSKQDQSSHRKDHSSRKRKSNTRDSRKGKILETNSKFSSSFGPSMEASSSKIVRYTQSTKRISSLSITSKDNAFQNGEQETTRNTFSNADGDEFGEKSSRVAESGIAKYKKEEGSTVSHKKRRVSERLRRFSGFIDTGCGKKSENGHKMTPKCKKTVVKHCSSKQDREESDSLFSDTDSLPDLRVSLSDNLCSDAEFTNSSKSITVPHSQKNKQDQSSHQKDHSGGKRKLNIRDSKKEKKVETDSTFNNTFGPLMEGSPSKIVRYTQSTRRISNSSIVLRDISFQNREQQTAGITCDISHLFSPDSQKKYEVNFLQSIKEEFAKLTTEDLKQHIRLNMPYFKNIVREKVINVRDQKFRAGPNVPFIFSSQKFLWLYEDYDFLIDLVSEEMGSVIQQANKGLPVIVYAAEVIVPELLKKIMLTFSLVKERGILSDEDCEEIFEYIMDYIDLPN